MREILFRGKRTKTGEWVRGLLWHHTEKASSIYSDELDKHVWVETKTIGQFTELTDRNGTKIFEGDIVDILTENEEIGVVEWDDGGFIVSADGICVDFQHNVNGSDVEIVGNIYDNPELVGGVDNG